MQYVVEWGDNKQESGRPCGRAVEMPHLNRRQACQLAGHAAFIFAASQADIAKIKAAILQMDSAAPRAIWVSHDQLRWVCVSRLDGVARGAFAAAVPNKGRLSHPAGVALIK